MSGWAAAAAVAAPSAPAGLGGARLQAAGSCRGSAAALLSTRCACPLGCHLCRAKLQAEFVGVQLRGWRVWPLATWINQVRRPAAAPGERTGARCASSLAWAAANRRSACPLRRSALPQVFVPLRFRVLFLNLVAFGWTTSLILSSRGPKKLAA